MNNNTGCLIVLFVAMLIFFGMYVELSVWNECRVDHSFFYCVYLLGNK